MEQYEMESINLLTILIGHPLVATISGVSLRVLTAKFYIHLFIFIYLLLKSYPKYKIDTDRNKAHDTDKNIKT